MPEPGNLLPSETGAGGCAWLLAWAAAIIFLVGSALLGLLVVAGNAGPFGIGAFFAGLIMALGVVLLDLSVALSLADGSSDLPGWRRLLAAACLIVGTSLGVVFVAQVAGLFEVAIDPLWPAAGAISFTAVAGLAAARAGERAAALLFALSWVVLLAVIGFRVATEAELRVIWLGPGLAGDERVWIAFSATRSGDFEIRHGSPSCAEGRVVAGGRYEFVQAPLGSTHGEPQWVELPAEALPLRAGDLIRVCLYDGLASATAAGDVISPPTFRPRD